MNDCQIYIKSNFLNVLTLFFIIFNISKWIKRCKSRKESVGSDPGRERPASAVTFNMTKIYYDLFKNDASMTTRKVAKSLGLSTRSAYEILKK